MSKERPEYSTIVSELRKGDVIVVWGIDRLGRATSELIKLMAEWAFEGMEAARAGGRVGGRPKGKFNTAEMLPQALFDFTWHHVGSSANCQAWDNELLISQLCNHWIFKCFSISSRHCPK